MRNNDQLAIEDYFVLYNMIKTGDIKKAQLFLSKAVKDYRRLLHQRQMEQMEAQNMANGKAAVMAEQEKAKTMQMKLQGDLAKIAAQGQEDRKTIEFEANFNEYSNKEKDKRKLGAELINKQMDAEINAPATNEAPQQQSE